MPGGLTVLKADAATAALIASHARDVEEYLRGEVSQLCGYFYVLMAEIGKSPELMKIVQARAKNEANEDTIVRVVTEVRVEIENLARTVAGLDSGELELVGWRYESDGPDVVKIGVWRKGRISAAASGQLEWGPLAWLVVLAATAVTTSGAWLLNLHLGAQKTAAEADAIRALTEQAITKSIAAASPADRPALVAAFEKAQNAAKTAVSEGGLNGPGWLARVGKHFGKVIEGAVSAAGSLMESAGSWLPWVLIGGAVLSALGSVERITRARTTETM